MSNINAVARRSSTSNRDAGASRLRTLIGELDLILQLLLFVAVFAVLVAGAAALQGPTSL
jgi:hypothetical protein